MFGFGSDRKKTLLMAGILRGANQAFDVGIAAISALRNREPPSYDDQYLGVILGFAEYIGRIHKASKSETEKALQSFLSDYPDGDNIFEKIQMIEIAGTQGLYRTQAGIALSNCTTEEGRTAAMIKLATVYFDK